MLRKWLDKVEPLFQEGGRLSKLYPLYEATDTFLYTPTSVTRNASHVRDGIDLKRMMVLVVIALGPCFFMAFYNTGYQANLAISQGASPLDSWHERVVMGLGVGHDSESFLDNVILGGLCFLPVYAVTILAGGLWEVLFAVVRKHEINEGFLVTSALFPLTLPPTIPLWQVALGISFGVVIGKEIFGGTGKNFLNPALTARAFLYFAYPAQITGIAVWTAAKRPDSTSGATPLGLMADTKVSETVPAIETIVGHSWWDCFLGFIPGSMGETSVVACLLGAALLLFVGIGSWRIMLGVVLGALGTSTLFWLCSHDSTNAMMYLPPWWQLVIGGFAFGTVFMATDPVSASMTNAGKWWYGLLIGLMTILIRVINPAYPEGIMLAILFGNVMAPLIDYFVIQMNIRRRMVRYEA
ncbi:MAG: NADH:ubiquinone reductase (Na(+)-transporting) subunit B [Pirellulales bacterium]|nr:NADH:ubiquinone reductase (Na(+)-transporting) subunit B [Pirellulales bacterium]